MFRDTCGRVMSQSDHSLLGSFPFTGIFLALDRCGFDLLLRAGGCIIRSGFHRMPFRIGDTLYRGLGGGQSKTRMGTNVALRQSRAMARNLPKLDQPPAK